MDKTQTLRRAQHILEAATNSTTNRTALSYLDEAQLHTDGYAEPGYTDPECGVIATGNWNHESHYEDHELIVDDDTLDRVTALLEKLGIELEWCDEWGDCYECGKLFRTLGDSYGWTASHWQGVCLECVDPVDVLEDLEGKSHTCLTLDNINPEDHGYVKANDEGYENGWYGGQDDSPDGIAANLKALGIERFLFNLDDVGQFDTHFSVYVHGSEAHLLKGAPEGKCEEDPAETLKKGLQSASVEMGKLEGDGIKYAKVSGDTATARLVSPEEFVAGIK